MNNQVAKLISELLSSTFKRTEKCIDGHHGKALIDALKAQGVRSVRNTAGERRDNINATLNARYATFTITESTCMGPFTAIVMHKHYLTVNCSARAESGQKSASTRNANRL